VYLDGRRKELDGRYSAGKAQMSDEDAELIGRLFVCCAKAAGGAHETLRGNSINVSTILSMTAHSKPQTIHADDTIQSLAIIYNASKVAVMGPEFLNQKPIILTGVGIQQTTEQGRTVNALPSLWKPTVHTAALGHLFLLCSSSHTLAHSPTCLTCAQNRMKLIKMWTALEGSEANPDVKESGILQPGDAVFFNPTHPHRGPRAPFPSTEGGGAGSEGGGGASDGQRTMIFMSACHTKGSSEGGAIFASAPAAPRQGRVWRDAFAITQEERAKVVDQSVLESPRKKPRKRAAHPDAGP
jgi:hypothetical protein